MKKLMIIMFVCFVCIGTYGQTTERRMTSDETVPAQFKTSEMQKLEEISIMSQSPLSMYMQKNIEYPDISEEQLEEGEVVVQFLIDKNGDVSNIQIVNSVSPQLDQTVIDCLKETDGQWQAALVDGEPVETEKKVYVIFDLAGNASHEDIALAKLQSGIDAINEANTLDANGFSEEKLKQKSYRLYNRALSLFEEAGKYKAEEASIAFWEAKAYSEMGNMSMMQEKLNEFNQLLSPDENLVKEYVMIGF